MGSDGIGQESVGGSSWLLCGEWMEGGQEGREEAAVVYVGDGGCPPPPSFLCPLVAPGPRECPRC